MVLALKQKKACVNFSQLDKERDHRHSVLKNISHFPYQLDKSKRRSNSHKRGGRLAER